jgi:uncharacterized protein (TIGR00303 family)
MIRTYSQLDRSQSWMQRFQGRSPLFACILGFTETGLLPGISAAGATPRDRQYTAVADAEFLALGAQAHPQYALPPLQAGASPVLISRAVVTAQQMPLYLFNAGLPHPPSVTCIDLGGAPARCLSQGNALDRAIARRLLSQGLQWGEKLAAATDSYVILSECVVGGTTTALAVLTGLGWDAIGKVNSSHPICNHQQKEELVQAGLSCAFSAFPAALLPPLALVAAVGDPMQIAVAGMAIAASRRCGVMLAGGTQMLAVYALIQAIAQTEGLIWQPEQIVVGTTRWVAEDPTGDTVGLAQLLKAPLLATQLSFAQSRYEALAAYERGFVKEGVGAGGSAIAATLNQGWGQEELLNAIETLANDYEQKSK